MSDCPDTAVGRYWVVGESGVPWADNPHGGRDMATEQSLEQELLRLRAQLAGRRATLPAHTVRVHQLAHLEELEERVREAEERLAALRRAP